MSKRLRVGDSDLMVFPINLGGNVFGWTADESASHAVLTAYVEAGGNFIDTADAYSAWVPGNSGGESERVIGTWLGSRSDRDDLVIATKVASHPARKGLAPANVVAALDDSLRRLQTDYVDLYYAHVDDVSVPIAEIAGVFSELVDEGKVRYPAISNLGVERIHGWMDAAKRGGLHAPVALQPLYNLMERRFESEYRDVASTYNLAVLPYNAMARGFLTGKYRPGTHVQSARAETGYRYLNEDRGPRVLKALDEIAFARGVQPGSVALAWLASAPTVVAPISSARTVGQLPVIMDSVSVTLSEDEMRRLDHASAR